MANPQINASIQANGPVQTNNPIWGSSVDANNGVTTGPPRPIPRQRINVPASQHSLTPVTDMIWDHKVKAGSIWQLVTQMEEEGRALQASMAALRNEPENFRIAFLMAKMVADKDKAMMAALEHNLRGALNSLRKLRRELHFVVEDYKDAGPLHVFQMLDGFVGALTRARGEDMEAWGEDGKELGRMRDRILADMMWWNDGLEE